MEKFTQLHILSSHEKSIRDIKSLKKTDPNGKNELIQSLIVKFSGKNIKPAKK